MNYGNIIALIVVAVFIAVYLKQKVPEIGIVMAASIMLCIILLSIKRLGSVIGAWDRLVLFINVDKTYLNILLKLVGIAYISEFGASLTKDAGFNSVGTQIELYGKLSMLVISLPVLLQVIETIISLL